MLKLLKLALICFPVIWFYSRQPKALASEQVKEIEPSNIELPQPRVSQLSDISSTSWSLKTLQGLDNRYQCLENNLGNQLPSTMTRNHFAQLLDQCLDKIQLTENSLSQDDLTRIKRLQQEFEHDLMTLKTPIKQLENQVSSLEKQTFSPQVELEGDAIIALAEVAQGENNSSLTLGTRLRLNLETSFTLNVA